MRHVVRLSELNEADLAVDAIRARLSEIAEGLKEPAALRAARANLAQAEAELVRWQNRQSECELAQRNAAEKLAKAEQHLYSGKVTVPKELEGLQAELAQFRRQQSQAEDELLEALIGVEAAAAQYSDQREAFQRLSAEWETTQANLRTEQARLKDQLRVAEARQAQARKSAPAELLPLYDGLRARRGGRAVAALDGDTCSACKIAASPSRVEAARYGEELVYCENCGRLLWGE